MGASFLENSPKSITPGHLRHAEPHFLAPKHPYFAPEARLAACGSQRPGTTASRSAHEQPRRPQATPETQKDPALGAGSFR